MRAAARFTKQIKKSGSALFLNDRQAHPINAQTAPQRQTKTAGKQKLQRHAVLFGMKAPDNSLSFHHTGEHVLNLSPNHQIAAHYPDGRIFERNQWRRDLSGARDNGRHKVNRFLNSPGANKASCG